MNTKYIFRPALCGLGALCLALVPGIADAKPGKGKGKGGDAPGQSEKGKPDKGRGKSDHKADFKPDGKAHGKADKEFAKDLERAHKDAGKDAKEFAKWREKRFGDEERRSVVEYFGRYRDNEHGLPPGLAKNLRRGKPLPPGWQKKLVPGYVVEDDFFSDFHPLSSSRFPGLEAVPDTRLYRYGDRIVRVYEPRREIIDVIPVPTIRLD